MPVSHTEQSPVHPSTGATSDAAIAALVAVGALAVAAGMPDHGASASHVPVPVPYSAANAHELLLGMTHDMRSPLSSILVLVERLRSGQSGPVSPLQERQLGLVYTAAFGLAALSNDVLELARGGTRLVAAEPVSFSLQDVLRTVRELVQPIAEEKGLVLRCSAPRDDARVGHPAALHRVLLNLVTNALKFTNSGSVNVWAEVVGADKVKFVVEDTGRGLPEAVQAQFAPGGAGTLPLGGGSFSSTGLGIAYCQQLLAMMGSELHSNAIQPVGTRFEFSLALPAA